MPALLVRLLWRARRNPAHWRNWHERLGIYRRSAPTPPTIWVHAVSVGESMAAVPLIRALREREGTPPIVVTTTTATGAETIARVLGDSVTHAYFPYDVPPAPERFLQRFQPRLLIILETELWPNVLAACRRRDIPVMVANARLSQRSLQAYLKLAPLSRELVRALTCIAAQTAADGERFRRLGAAPDRISITGSLKFDLDLPASLLEQAEALRRSLGVNRPVLMLGSTREGEEAILLEACRTLREEFTHLLVVLAPRHPERFAQARELAVDAGFEVVTYSSGRPCTPTTGVYLLDVMGELPRFYAAADIAFVGGSLLDYGGHNVLEPAALGTPVLTGPHVFNFAEICRLLAAGGALHMVADGAELVAAAARWLRDSNERDAVGRTGRDIVLRHRGATRTTLRLIDACLGHADAPPAP